MFLCTDIRWLVVIADVKLTNRALDIKNDIDSRGETLCDAEIADVTQMTPIN